MCRTEPNFHDPFSSLQLKIWLSFCHFLSGEVWFQMEALSADLWRLILSHIDTLKDLKSVLCVKYFKKVIEHTRFWTDLYHKFLPNVPVPSEPLNALKQSFVKEVNSRARHFSEIDMKHVTFGKVEQKSKFRLVEKMTPYRKQQDLPGLYVCPVSYRGSRFRFMTPKASTVTSVTMEPFNQKYGILLRFDPDSDFVHSFLKPLQRDCILPNATENFTVDESYAHDLNVGFDLSKARPLLFRLIFSGPEPLILGLDGRRMQPHDVVRGCVVRAQICLEGLYCIETHNQVGCRWKLEKLMVLKCPAVN